MRQRQQQLTALAKMLEYILAHRPDEFGLVLDRDGWVPVKELLRALTDEPGWGYVRRSHLEEVVYLEQPGAFILEGDAIRAAVPPELRGARPVSPPLLLYKAITLKSYPVVAERGLVPPPGRDNVLAATAALAQKLGQRRDPKALVVAIRAQAAVAAGSEFYPYGAELFLTGALGPEYLQLPPPPREVLARQAAKAAKPAKPEPPTPGSVLVDWRGKPVKPWQQPKERRRGPTWKEAAKEQRRRKRGTD